MQLILFDAEIPPGEEIKVGPFEICPFELTASGPVRVTLHSIPPHHAKLFVRSEAEETIRCSVMADLMIDDQDTE